MVIGRGRQTDRQIGKKGVRQRHREREREREVGGKTMERTDSVIIVNETSLKWMDGWMDGLAGRSIGPFVGW